MRIISNVTVLDLVWSGPYQLADLLVFTGAEDYGVYQIYGTHDVNGPDNLLYIGMAQASTRIMNSRHRAGAGRSDSSRSKPGRGLARRPMV
jgi:hypothetical protein